MRMNGAIIASILFASATVGRAERPITPEGFRYDPAQGYFLVWVGPMKGRKSFKDYLDFVRLDPMTGKTLVEDDGLLRSTNARRQKDAAAVYYEAKPWIIENDRGLFLIPVNPGRWVVSGVNNTALSLGSYGFQVEPGKISYIGTVLTGQEDGSSEVPEIKAIDLSKGGAVIAQSNMPSTLVLRFPNRGDVPSDFPAEHLLIPKIERDVRFNNYLSSLVSRAADLGLMEHEAPVAKSQIYKFNF